VIKCVPTLVPLVHRHTRATEQKLWPGELSPITRDLSPLLWSFVTGQKSSTAQLYPWKLRTHLCPVINTYAPPSSSTSPHSDLTGRLGGKFWPNIKLIVCSHFLYFLLKARWNNNTDLFILITFCMTIWLLRQCKECNLSIYKTDIYEHKLWIHANWAISVYRT